jgi:hypothetical protein
MPSNPVHSPEYWTPERRAEESRRQKIIYEGAATLAKIADERDDLRRREAKAMAAMRKAGASLRAIAQPARRSPSQVQRLLDELAE